MSGEVPVCDILLEAAEYLSTLGSNLRARSQNLRDKRISKDKLRNTHAVVKAADKLLLICDLSKKSLENVETGIKRILNVCGANTSSKSHTSSKTSKSGAEFQYFRHGLRKLKISKNVPIERYTSAKVAVAKLASAILDNHPIYYDCKLYRRRKAAENKEKERGNKPISLESDDNDTQKSEDCSAKKKSNIRVNNIVESSDDEIKPKNSTHSDSSDKESEEKSKHSQSKNDSPKEKAKDKGETASKKRKKIILSDSDSESNLSTVKDPKEKCKVTDLDGNESSLPKESKVNSINTTDDDDKSSKKTGEQKENSEDDQNGKTSSFDDDIKTSVAKASKEDSRNESDADEIKSSDDEIKSFTTEASKKNNKKDSDNYSSDNEIKSPSLNAVQKNSKKESDDDDNKCSDDGIKSKSKAFKKNSKNYSNIDDNNDSDHEIASSSPKAAKENSENDSDVDDNKRSDDEIIHSIPMVSKEGKSKNNLDGKENSSEEEGRSIDPVSEKPLLKCIDITKLLKPDIADKKQKVEKEKKVRFCIDLSSPSKKTPNNKKDIELEKRLEEKRKEEKYWEEKREAVKAFQPKSFKIMLTKFPDFTNDFLDSNNIQKIIQNGKVIAEKEIETCDSEICIDNNDEGNKQGKIIVEPEANPVAPIEVLKAKSALLDDSGSEHSNPSTCALNETGDINPIIQETDKAGENNVKTKKRKRLVSSDYDDKKSTNKDDISPDYKKDKSHSDDTPSTPKPKRKRSDSTTPQSKSKHIRESMHAKKMLLTYSSSETEDEELKNALREIKDSLLSQDDDEKEIESVKDQVIKAHKKKLIYSSSEDEKEETAKKKTKEDDLNEENHIEVSLKESSLTPSNENSNKVSHDDNLSPSEDNIFTQGSLKESSPELSSTNVDEHSSSSSKVRK